MESISWFKQDAFGYFFPVKHLDCDRVYKKTEYFRFEGRKCKSLGGQNGKIRLVAIFYYEEALKLGFLDVAMMNMKSGLMSPRVNSMGK